MERPLGFTDEELLWLDRSCTRTSSASARCAMEQSGLESRRFVHSRKRHKSGLRHAFPRISRIRTTSLPRPNDRGNGSGSRHIRFGHRITFGLLFLFGRANRGGTQPRRLTSPGCDEPFQGFRSWRRSYRNAGREFPHDRQNAAIDPVSRERGTTARCGDPLVVAGLLRAVLRDALTLACVSRATATPQPRPGRVLRDAADYPSPQRRLGPRG